MIARGFRSAVDAFEAIRYPFELALARTDFGVWLASEGRGEEAKLQLAAAKEIFERLRAKPWIERLDALDRVPGAGV